MRSLVFVLVAAFALSGCWDWARLDSIADGGADALNDTIATDSPLDASMCGALALPCCATDGAASCSSGLVCSNGHCNLCDVGLVSCARQCVNLSSDLANCGACGQTCASHASCVSGICVTHPPPNDTRDQATMIDTSISATTLDGDTTGAHNDTIGSCACTSGADVFYQFTLSVPEIVYADTLGSSFDTSLFLQDASGTNVTDSVLANGAACNNDNGIGCNTGAQSMIAAKLFDGTYYLVLSGCGAGAATIHFQHLPSGNGTLTRLSPAAGTSQQYSDSLGGSGWITSACCSVGPENTYWMVTCPNFVSTMLHASTCAGTSINTELDQRSATRAPVSQCNDDACGAQSQLDASLPSGAGLHTLYVDSCVDAPGDYLLSLTLGNCTMGSLCAAQCVDMQTSPTNCGACGRVCPSGPANTTPTCSAGHCATPCSAGHGDCNGLSADGCETDLDTIDQCGACGNACSSVYGTPGCVGGTCTIACNPGYGNCDGMVSTGCETNLQNDRSNCGTCGHRCPGSHSCSAGGC